MKDIICPSCSKAFKIDETDYSDILNQVRNSWNCNFRRSNRRNCRGYI